MNKAKQYIDELNRIDEHIKIEAKQCSDRIDKSVLETVCSFSNEPELGGGTIIIGLKESDGELLHYDVIGVKDSDKLQKDLATQCATMFNHPVRPMIEPDTIDGKEVLVVTVPELDSKHKPLYFEREGLPRGAWRRVGSTDQRCTEEDLSLFYNDADGFDKAVAEDTDLDDIDENAVRRYRQLRKQVNSDAEELNYSDFDLLRSLKAVSRDRNGIWRLTNTGLLVFGTQMALRREMPSVRVDYIRVPGTEWISDPHSRFESIDMRGPMLLLISRVFNAIADDLPRGFSLNSGNLQADRPLSVPEEALREAIVNALVHQSLRVHRPIQVIRYSNRIEIINPGFSLKPIETLGEPGSEMRNPTIGSIFHETQLAEAKGTGISTMRRLMKEASMMPPTFESDHTRNIFITRILLHHFVSADDLKWLSTLGIKSLTDTQKVVLIFVHEVGAIDNGTYRQLSGLLAREATKELKNLMNYELIEPKGHGRQTYYVPTEKFKSLCGHNGATSESNGATSESNGAISESNGATSESNGATLPEFSTQIVQKLESLGKRTKKTELEGIIVEMCKMAPLSVEEIAEYTKRTVNHIRNKVLPGLLREKRIRFTIPDMINHPNQKYTV